MDRAESLVRAIGDHGLIFWKRHLRIRSTISRQEGTVQIDEKNDVLGLSQGKRSRSRLPLAARPIASPIAGSGSQEDMVVFDTTFPLTVSTTATGDRHAGLLRHRTTATTTRLPVDRWENPSSYPEWSEPTLGGNNDNKGGMIRETQGAVWTVTMANVGANDGTPSKQKLLQMDHQHRHQLSRRCPSSPSLCSSSTCSSEDDLPTKNRSSVCDHRAALTEARTLLGFPYPLLFFLLISFVVLPMQVVHSSLCTSRGSVDTLSSSEYSPAVLDSRRLSTTASGAASSFSLDAVVFVAIGLAAVSPVLGLSVNSVVTVGDWDGPIYVITDAPSAVRAMIDPSDDAHSVGVQSQNLHILPLEQHDIQFLPANLSVFNAKVIKCSLLHILPNHLKNMLYIDSDVIVGQSLNGFRDSVASVWSGIPGNDDDVFLRKPSTTQATPELALFPDGRSFTAGFCQDCDTWNTGVMSLSRGHSDDCMDAWCEALALHGGTDQAALDAVVAGGTHCQAIQSLNTAHVRMMKDIFVVGGIVGRKTFNHFTGIFRPHKLSALHRKVYERALHQDLGILTQIETASVVQQQHAAASDS